MKGARGVLINITGGLDMTLFEVDEAANRIRDEVDPEANIIFGSTFDQTLDGKIRISVVATGIEAQAMTQPRPNSVLRQSQPGRRGPCRPRQPAADGGERIVAACRHQLCGRRRCADDGPRGRAAGSSRRLRHGHRRPRSRSRP